MRECLDRLCRGLAARRVRQRTWPAYAGDEPGDASITRAPGEFIEQERVDAPVPMWPGDRDNAQGSALEHACRQVMTMTFAGIVACQVLRIVPIRSQSG
ncbi:hypothetical protein DMB66_14325 [Actinoplanes sp. ATCC 53533]|nr:hypothetical protein DMB66_14325 [Actinoplanes sp. ATCC 53533]